MTGQTLGAPPFTSYARVFPSAAQTFVTATFTAVAYGSEEADNDNMHDPVTNNSRLTCRTPGIYHTVGTLQWNTTSTAGRRILRLRKNNVEFASNEMYPGNSADTQQVTGTIELVVGDFLELFAFQSTGGNLDSGSAAIVNNFTTVKVGLPT